MSIRFLAAGGSATLGKSLNGASWSAGPSFAGLVEMRFVDWFPASALWLATSGTGGTGGYCAKSPDGVTWTAVTTGFEGGGQRINSMYYRSGRWFALGITAGFSLRTSPDLITWTTRSSGLTQAYRMSDNGATIVIVGYNGVTFYASYSLDNGVNWASGLTEATAPMTATTYSTAAGLFIAGGGTPGTGLLYTSPNGITWTTRTAPEANAITELTYGNGVVVLATETGNVYTSTDGINYTLRVTMTPGEIHGRFLAGANRFAMGDTTDSISMSDSTGATWGAPVTANAGAGNIQSIASRGSADAGSLLALF